MLLVLLAAAATTAGDVPPASIQAQPFPAPVVPIASLASEEPTPAEPSGSDEPRRAPAVTREGGAGGVDIGYSIRLILGGGGRTLPGAPVRAFFEMAGRLDLMVVTPRWGIGVCMEVRSAAFHSLESTFGLALMAPTGLFRVWSCAGGGLAARGERAPAMSGPVWNASVHFGMHEPLFGRAVRFMGTIGVYVAARGALDDEGLFELTAGLDFDLLTPILLAAYAASGD